MPFMYQEGLPARTMKSYMAAVRHKSCHGMGYPIMVMMLQMLYVLKGRLKKARTLLA